MRVSLSWMVGFMGLFSMGKGARSGVRAVEVRGGHVGSEEHRAHEILAGAGPHAALVLVRCKDPQTRQMVAAAAADKASDSWRNLPGQASDNPSTVRARSQSHA